MLRLSRKGASRQFSSQLNGLPIRAQLRRYHPCTSPNLRAHQTRPTLCASSLSIPVSRTFFWGSKSTSQSPAVDAPPPSTIPTSSTPLPDQEVLSQASSTTSGSSSTVSSTPTTSPEASALDTLLPESSTSTGTSLLDDVLPNIPIDAIHALPQLHQFGDFAAMGIASWFSPQGIFVNFVEMIHVTAGGPWWVSLMLASVGIRLAILPLLLKGIRSGEKLKAIQPKLNDIALRTKAAMHVKDQVKVQALQAQQLALYKEANINPLAPLAPVLVNLLTAIGAFGGTRRMVTLENSPLAGESFLWIPDIRDGDVALALAVVPATAWFLRRATLDSPEPETKDTWIYHMPNLAPFFSGFFTLGLAFFSTAQLVAVITSTVLMALQTALLRRPSVRAYLKLGPQAKRTAPPLKETIQWATAKLKKTPPPPGNKWSTLPKGKKVNAKDYFGR